MEIGEKTLEDIKIRLCFVTNDTRGSQIQEIKADASSVSGLSSFLKKSVSATDYIVCGDTVLKIDGQIREGVCEVLFERDEDKLNIPSMILDALLASPIGEQIGTYLPLSPSDCVLVSSCEMLLHSCTN